MKLKMFDFIKQITDNLMLDISIKKVLDRQSVFRIGYRRCLEICNLYFSVFKFVSDS